MIGIARTGTMLAYRWTDSALPYGIALVALLLVGAVAIALVKRWQQRDASSSVSASEQLAAYRSLYEQGVMSKEEFERLRALLGFQIRQTPKTQPVSDVLPTPPPTNGTAPPPGAGGLPGPAGLS